MTVVLTLCWGVIGLLTFNVAVYRRFTARADGRVGSAPFIVDLACGAAGLWVLGATVYFGLIDA